MRSRVPASAVVCAWLAAACASPPPEPIGEHDQSAPKIRLAKVADPARATREFDTEAMLRGALERALSKRDLLGAREADAGEFELSLEIDRYEPGNAFKRWLMPGYGPTVLRVRGELVDPGTGEVVTHIDHQRRVDAGGGFTIGAWRRIFDRVATDLANDFARHRTAAEFVAHEFVDGDDEPNGLSDGLADGLSNNLVVAPSPPSQPVVEASAASTPRAFSIERFVDRRAERGRIGERHAAFGVPMGGIQTGRDVAGLVQSVLTDALRASGHTVTGDGATHVAGEVSKFWVHTDTTPLYWDIVGEIELRVSLRSAPQAAPSAATTFACEHTERTWWWPSEDLVQQVLDRCVDELGQAIAKDPIWRESPAREAGQTSEGSS